MKLGRALLLRILISLVATGVWWWIGIRFAGIEVYPQDPGGKFVTLIWFAGTGFIWWLTLAVPAIMRWADSWGSLFWPSDANIEVRPDFSIARAREKQARYAEAVAEYRKAAEQFPEEVTPHMRVAELLLNQFDDADGAIAELEAALTKAQRDDTYAMVSQRLADVHIEHRKDRAAAIACLRRLVERLPGQKSAKAAQERIQRLSS